MHYKSLLFIDQWFCLHNSIVLDHHHPQVYVCTRSWIGGEHTFLTYNTLQHHYEGHNHSFLGMSDVNDLTHSYIYKFHGIHLYSFIRNTLYLALFLYLENYLHQFHLTFVMWWYSSIGFHTWSEQLRRFVLYVWRTWEWCQNGSTAVQ